ncbi:18108_t:CDS:2, partial [Rhizophagus irregularis]
LISYLKKQGNKSSYCRFLNLHHNFIVASIFSDNWKDLDNTWFTHFLEEVERLDLNKVLKEKENYCVDNLGYQAKLSIQEYKENLEPINTSNSIKVQVKQKEKLKRVRDDDTTESS